MVRERVFSFIETAFPNLGGREMPKGPVSNASILRERIVTLKDVPSLVPTCPHFATVYRWTVVGIRGHKLETFRIGSRVITSAEAVERFLKATQRNEVAA